MALLSALFVLAGCNTRTLSGRVWKLESTPDSFQSAIEFRDQKSLRVYSSKEDFHDEAIEFISPTEFNLLENPKSSIYFMHGYGKYEVTFESKEKIKMKAPDGFEETFISRL